VSPKLGGVAALFNARYAVGNTNQIIRSFADDAPGWVESRGALLDIAAEARGTGAQFLVVVFPMMVDFGAYPLRQAHEKIVKFGRDHGIEMLDLMTSLERQRVSDMTVLLDGHPNGRAHRIFAEHILRYLSQPPEGALRTSF